MSKSQCVVSRVTVHNFLPDLTCSSLRELAIKDGACGSFDSVILLFRPKAGISRTRFYVLACLNFFLASVKEPLW